MLDELGDSTKSKCPNRRSECDTFALGSLIRALRDVHLYPPAGKISQNTVHDVMCKLQNLRLKKFCDGFDNIWDRRSRKYDYYQSPVSGTCGSSDHITAIQALLMRETKGITLESLLVPERLECNS